MKDWGVGEGKSYLVPAWEIPAFELLLNRVDHYAVDSQVYASPLSNFKDNLHHKWVVDNDAFATNQFLHPYQGAFYQGLARSSGLDFWQSSAYTFAGSLLWEYAGETTRPSINDQVASGIAGNFLGEPLFRMASLLLESGPDGEPGLLRKIGAAIISPSMGLNRLLYGDRFAGVFRSNDPAVYTRVDLGASLSTHFTSNVNVNADLTAPPAAQTLQAAKRQRHFHHGLWPARQTGLQLRPAVRLFQFRTERRHHQRDRNAFSAADCCSARTMRLVPTTAASGACMAPTNMSARKYFASPPPRPHWGPRASGGCRAKSHCKARRCSAWVMGAAGSFMAPVWRKPERSATASATITTVWRRKVKCRRA